MQRKVGGHYRDQYFEKYMDYLCKETDASRKKEGKAPYSYVTLKTMATDTFFGKSMRSVTSKNGLFLMRLLMTLGRL